MPRKTTETVGPCAAPGTRFENWSSTVRTVGVTDGAVSAAADYAVTMLDIRICRYRYPYTQADMAGSERSE